MTIEITATPQGGNLWVLTCAELTTLDAGVSIYASRRLDGSVYLSEGHEIDDTVDPREDNWHVDANAFEDAALAYFNLSEDEYHLTT